MVFRPSKLEPWQVAAAEKLHEIWKSSGVPQSTIADQLDVQSQGQVSQMLTGKRPINAIAAAHFARALGCKVDDFSPELADEIRMASATVNKSSGNPEGWPFSFSPERFDRLGRDEKQRVEGAALALILEFEMHSAQHKSNGS
ncbi:MAG: hypothetical protein J0H09_09040 [Burkholderiales bacterium]|nr:hypothetical protein [Burkholderiales bacterium]